MSGMTRRGVQATVVLLALLLAAGGVALALLSRTPESPPATDLALRNEVKRVASAFAANVNTYSSDDIEAYRQNVEPLLTSTFAKSFDASMQDIVSQMRQAKITSTGEIRSVGVSSIDRDSAVALVVCDADVKSQYGDRARHFRWRVDLVREESGADWLVDEFTPV